jgi:AAA domain
MAVKKEKDYAAIAAKKMYRPATRERMPRILVYSRNKKGKTYFSISAGPSKTLVLDPEYGTAEMKTRNPHVWPIEVWTDMDEAYEFLRHVNKCPFDECPDKGHPFTWVSVDGLTKINNLALKHVMKVQEERSLDRIPGMVQKQDYGKSGELMKDLLTKFHNLPQGIVFTCQERQVESFDSEEDIDYEESAAWYVPDLPKGVRGSANAIVDVIGRLYVVKTSDDPPKAERRLWLGDSVKYDTGYRSDFVLPDHLKSPTVPKLVELMRTGTVTSTKKKKGK